MYGQSHRTTRDDEVSVSGVETPAGLKEQGEVYAELGSALLEIWRSTPDSVDREAWTELVLKAAGRVGEHGRMYKKDLGLSSKASRITWKDENSVAGIFSITKHWRQNSDGDPRAAKTEMRVGWPALEADRICNEKGIEVEVAVAVAETVAEAVAPTEISATAQASAPARTSTDARTSTEVSTALVTSALHAYVASTYFTWWEDEGFGPSLSGSGWSPLRTLTGMEGVGYRKASSQATDCQELRAITETLLSSTQVVNAPSIKVDTAPQPPLLVRRALQRQTCERGTIEAIYEHVPEAKEDKVLFRWIVYALWTTWRDSVTNNRVLHHKVVHWIGCHRFATAEDVLQYIEERLSIEFSDTYAKGSHTRQILDDGLLGQLWKAVKADLDTSPSEYGTRVYVLNGRVVTHKDAARMREELREEVDAMTPPSATSHRIWKHMNELPSRRFDRFQDRINEALEYVDRMEIDVSISALQKARLRGYTGCRKDEDTGELTGNVTRYHARVRREKREKAEEQRREYKKILHSIAQQHKPFYKPSRKERTDRIFAHNDSALLLPSEVREILCAGLYDVDLKSAHLLIAAWLWGAETALEKLTQEGYSIWDDLMEHCRPLFEERSLEVPDKGSDLYEEVKAGMKIMVYSAVYGMPASSIQAETTKALGHILGPDVGEHLREHDVIASILEKRDEVLSGLEPGDTLEAPSGIDIEVEVSLEDEGDDNDDDEENDEDLVGPRSAVATQAQAYEQELMSVLLGVTKERSRTRLMLWLHDGAICQARHPNGLEQDANEALEQKRQELTEFAGKDTLIPSIFEVEEVEMPDFPPKTIHDRIASAGGGVLRLKDGEAAVRVDEETGEALGPVGTGTLIKAEHALYKIAGEYVRITDDGYSIESDPYPQEKLWQTLDSSTSSTSSNETATEETTTEESRETQSQKSQPEAAPGAESHSKEALSADSDTSTTAANRSSPDPQDASERGAEDREPAVRARLRHKTRVCEGDVPPDPVAASDEGFSKAEWMHVHA